MKKKELISLSGIICLVLAISIPMFLFACDDEGKTEQVVTPTTQATENSTSTPSGCAGLLGDYTIKSCEVVDKVVMIDAVGGPGGCTSVVLDAARAFGENNQIDALTIKCESEHETPGTISVAGDDMRQWIEGNIDDTEFLLRWELDGLNYQ